MQYLIRLVILVALIMITKHHIILIIAAFISAILLFLNNIDYTIITVFFIIVISLSLIYAYFGDLSPEHKVNTIIAYSMLIITLIGLFSGKIDVNIFGDRPDLDGGAKCYMITSKMIEEKKISMNESLKDYYYADIYYLVAKDPVENAQMKVNIPKDINYFSYKSFPEDNTRFMAENMAVIAEWNSIPPDYPKHLVILYDGSEGTSKILKSEDRTYTYTAYNNRNGNREREITKLNCDKTGWDIFRGKFTLS